MIIKYSKEFARNYSLFQVVAYTQFAKRSVSEFRIEFNTGHPLFIYTGKRLVSIYYPPNELKQIFGEFGKGMADPDYFSGVEKKFWQVIEEIKPYFEKKRTVGNLAELEQLYELYLDFLYGESAFWVAPLVPTLIKKHRNRALEIREQTQELTALRDELFDHSLSQLFPELGGLVHWLLPSSVFNHKAVDALTKEAKKYQSRFVYFENQIYTGELGEILGKLKIEIMGDTNKEKKDLKGQTASPGKITGKAKVVFTNKDLGKVQEGDILVSPMTRPDFLPAMRLANAFITDEGGITCHAAIVAREMKKPCVIGTRVATEMIQDGDQLEVDADEGIVKKLE
jgi:phosphohistidine swiveling domain-containing protein